MKTKERSVYRRGAEDGLLLGPLMALTVVLLGATPFVWWMFYPALVAVISVPVVAYRLLYRGLKEDLPGSGLSATWMHGLMMYLCGGLLMALVVYVLLQWVYPGYYRDVVAVALDVLRHSNTAQGSDLLTAFEKMHAEGLYPASADVVKELLYFVAFTGSVFSLIVSPIVRWHFHRNPPTATH